MHSCQQLPQHTLPAFKIHNSRLPPLSCGRLTLWCQWKCLLGPRSKVTSLARSRHYSPADFEPKHIFAKRLSLRFSPPFLPISALPLQSALIWAQSSKSTMRWCNRTLNWSKVSTRRRREGWKMRHPTHSIAGFCTNYSHLSFALSVVKRTGSGINGAWWKSANEHVDSGADSSSGRWWQVGAKWQIFGCFSSPWSWPGTCIIVHLCCDAASSLPPVFIFRLQRVI